MNPLLDTWVREGRNHGDFVSEVDAMTARTGVVCIPADNVRFCVTLDDPYGKGKEKILFTCPPCGEDMLSSPEGMGTCVSRDEETRHIKHVHELYTEATEYGVFAFVKNGKDTELCPVSRTIASDLGIVGIKGDVCQGSSYHLFGLLSYQMGRSPFSYCFRTADGVSKLFAIRSGRYSYVPQREMLEAADKICAGGVLDHWHIDNYVTNAMWSFPGEATTLSIDGGTFDAVPVIAMWTSDVGQSACRFTLGWKCGGGLLFLARGKTSASRKHVGGAIMADFVADAERLRDKFQIFPERLAALERIPVASCEIHAVVSNLCDDAGITRLGKAIKDRIVGRVTAGLADTTAASIIVRMMQVDVPNASDAQLKQLAECCGDAVYARIRRRISDD